MHILKALGIYWQVDKRCKGMTHRLIEEVEHVNASMASEWQAKNQHGQRGCHHHLQSRRCHGDFCLRVWCKILTKLSRFLSFSLILCENKFLCLWFVRSQIRPLIAQCSDHRLKCPENAAQQCDIYCVVKIFLFRHNWWEIIYLPKASVISMRKKRADHTFHKNISSIATFDNEESVMGYWSVRNYGSLHQRF